MKQSPGTLEAEKKRTRKKQIALLVQQHKGKDPKTMLQKDKDDLFIAMLKKLGMLDENDKIK